MHSSIFKVIPFRPRSFLQKLLKQQPEENAVIELNNLLARVPIQSIKRREVETLGQPYGVSIETEFGLNLEEFYAVLLAHCLKTETLGDNETADLLHLKRIFSLSDEQVANLHVLIGTDYYRKAFENATQRGRLSQTAKEQLHKLALRLQLPPQTSKTIANEVGSAYLNNYIERLIAEQQFSPQEETEIQSISESLNVPLQLKEGTKAQLAKLKLYWALENTDLPAVQTDIALQRSETCFIQIRNAKWYELRSVRQRTTYSGYSTSFKIAKGFYLRSGSYTPRSYSVDQMTLIDTGHLYLTNKRIIFMGSKKNSNIRLEKILSITPYNDGVEISKETGKTPSIQFTDRADMFCIILERLLRERG